MNHIRVQKLESFGYILVVDIIMGLSSVNLLYQLAQRATGFDEMTRHNSFEQPFRRSVSFKVITSGTNRKPVCDFLLVNKTNLHPMSHRCDHFLGIAD